MTKKITPKSKATAKTSDPTSSPMKKTPKKKSAAAKKTTTSKKLELEAEVAAESKASDAPAEKPRDQIPPIKPDATGPRFETPPAESKQQRRGSGRFVGRLAIFLALVALTGTAYLAFVTWRAASSEQDSDAALASLDETLNATRDSLSSLEQGFDNLASRDVASVGELQAMERRLNERVENFESLPGRVDNLEGSIASLQGISKGARDTWLLSEAEYYMQSVCLPRGLEIFLHKSEMTNERPVAPRGRCPCHQTGTSG